MFSFAPQFFQRYAHACFLALCVAMVPAMQGMVKVGDCCIVDGSGVDSCSTQIEQSNDCCQHELGIGGSSSLPSDDEPCGCVCCDMMVLTSRVLLVEFDGQWFDTSQIAFLPLTPRLCPESRSVGVDIQPPIV